MNSEIKELNFEELKKDIDFKQIKNFYELELELENDKIIQQINLDKTNFIEKNYLRYKLDENYRKTIDFYNIEAPIKTKEILGKYFEEIYKNKLKHGYRLKIDMDFENKIINLKNKKIYKNENLVRICILNNEVIAFVKYLETDKLITIVDIYSKLKNEGIGSKLINSFNKDKNIKVDIRFNNSSRLFFEKVGFKYINIENNKFYNNEICNMIKKTINKDNKKIK